MSGWEVYSVSGIKLSTLSRVYRLTVSVVCQAEIVFAVTMIQYMNVWKSCVLY